MNTTGAKESRVFLTGKDNFRDSLVDYYKKNRDPEQKPVHYAKCKEFLLRKYKAEVIDGMEADDALGINQTEYTIICTIDKDLDMIPGWHYNWQKDTRYFVSEQGAIEWFYTQLLTGDSTDNIPGLFQTVGTKASAKLKEGIKGKSELELWNYVSKLYTDGGASIDKVVEIARLLWIHRDKTAPLWEPPNG
jgi:5'-3' exonuclease